MLHARALESPAFALCLAYEAEHLANWSFVRCFTVNKATAEQASDPMDLFAVEAATGDAYECIDGKRSGRLRFVINLFGPRPEGVCFLPE